MIRRLAVSACLCLFLLPACSSEPDPKHVSAVALARDVPLSAAFAPQGKTLGECLDRNGYGDLDIDPIDTVQPRRTEDGDTVYKITYYGDEDLSVGVSLEDQAVGGWEPEDVRELKSLGCVIDGPSRLDLS